jgi:hypothetical protein
MLDSDNTLPNSQAVLPLTDRTTWQGGSSLKDIAVGLVLLVFAGSAEAQPTEDTAVAISDLRRQIQAQQEQLDAQGRQLASQAELLNRLASRLVPAAAPERAFTPGNAQPDDIAVVPSAEIKAVAKADVAPPELKADRFAAGPGVVVVDMPGFKATLGGALRTNALFSSARGIGGSAAPFFLAPPESTGAENVFDITAQYSQVNLSLEGPSVGGFSTGALVLFQFYNGAVFSNQYGFTPGLVFAYAANERWNVSAGRRGELFSDRAPGMVDTMTILGASGNPGNSVRSQVRVEHTTPMAAGGKFTAALAISDPISTSISADFADRTEDNGLPNFEAKLAFATAPPGSDVLLDRPVFEIGISGVYGEFRKFYELQPPFSVEKYSLEGVALDGGLRLGDRFGLQGEVYQGRGLGNYLGLANQTVNPQSLEIVTGSGGWGEASWVWQEGLQSNFGYGLDHPDLDTISVGSIGRNETAYGNLIWTVRPWLRLSAEATWRKTGYLLPTMSLLSNDGLGLNVATEMRF